MSKLIKMIKNEQIQLSISIGLSIIILAYVSKWIMHIEFSYLKLAVPGFVMAVFEAARKNKKYRKYVKLIYGHLAIWGSTAIVIILHL
ncbi:MAG: hypothetical protein ABIJ45_15110 [Candidatus Zixiibacteriota bacterium]